MEARLDAVERAVGQGDPAVGEEVVHPLASLRARPTWSGCARVQAGDEAASEIALEVDGDVQCLAAERADEFAHLARRFADPAEPAEGLAPALPLGDDQAVEQRVVAEEARRRCLNDPHDAARRVGWRSAVNAGKVLITSPSSGQAHEGDAAMYADLWDVRVDFQLFSAEDFP